MSIVGFGKILCYSFVLRSLFFPGLNKPREVSVEGCTGNWNCNGLLEGY